MTNEIDSTGIHIQTLPEIIDELTTSYKNIYGDDIDLSQNTPDGQRVNIEAQAKYDSLALAVQVYNSFDPDTVIGVNQDRLYKINGVFRKSALFSFVEVNVTTTGPVTLQGLGDRVYDLDAESYTVSDASGNKFYLVNDTVITSAGTYLLDFRAADYGAIQVSPNTITNMVTVLANISGVNNPAAQYIIGTQEESDEDFRIRRNQSTAIAGRGWYDSIKGALLSIDTVDEVALYVNSTNTTDADSIPAHSIWAVIKGGLDTDIAQTIYAQLPIAVGMKGSTSIDITREDGGIFTAKFDRPTSENLYIKMTIQSKSGATPDTDYIKEKLVENIILGIYQSISSSEIISQVLGINDDVYINSCEVSKNNSTWTTYLLPSSKSNIFSLATSRITITVA